MSDALFREVVSTRQHGTQVKSQSGYARNLVWNNTNPLLKTEGYIGIKTGTTDAAGACLVSCSQRQDQTLYVVILGASGSAAREADSRNSIALDGRLCHPSNRRSFISRFIIGIFLDSKEFEMPIHRRTILSQAAGIAGILSIGVEKALAQSSKGPLVIATWPFGLEACKESLRVMNTPGKTAMDGVEAGIRLVEADLTNRSVGIGGDPNSEGVLQLDACVMDGQRPRQRSGAGGLLVDSSIRSLWLASSS